jgi:GPH family glycoside/pentoside/hexuronide:cation symporter
MASATAAKDRVKASWLFAYSLPGLPIAAMGLPLAVHLPNFYAVDVGLGYAVAGSIFLLTRVLDIFLDPIMGVVSDRVRTRWGRRRIWMVLSVPIMIAASVLLFMPAPGISWAATTGALVLLFVGWTMLTITHLAWGGELSGDYHERSRVTASREAAYIVGMFTVLLLPVIIQAQGGDRFAQIAAFGWYVIITLPIGVLVAVTVIKERDVPPAPHIPLKAALAAIATNRPLRYVLFCDLIAGLSTGTVATLFIAMMTVGLELGKQANVLLLIYFAMGVVFIPPMVWVSRKLGKHQTLAYSSLVNAILIPCIFLLPKGEFWPAAVLWALFGLNMGVGPFLFRAIMADVADHDHVETGQARAGVYFALLALTNKAGYSIAIGLTFWTLALIGFQEKAVNPPEVVTATLLLYIVPPTLVSLLVAAVMWRFPLDETKQRELRRIIEERSAAGTAIGAGVGHTLEDEPELPEAAQAAVPKPAE